MKKRQFLIESYVGDNGVVCHVLSEVLMNQPPKTIKVATSSEELAEYFDELD